MAKKQVEPLPQYTVEEIRAACEAPLPAGVTMVLMKKTVTGLQIHEGGVSVLDRSDHPWRQLPAVTKGSEVTSSQVTSPASCWASILA